MPYLLVTLSPWGDAQLQILAEIVQREKLDQRTDRIQTILLYAGMIAYFNDLGVPDVLQVDDVYSRAGLIPEFIQRHKRYPAYFNFRNDNFICSGPMAPYDGPEDQNPYGVPDSRGVFAQNWMSAKECPVSDVLVVHMAVSMVPRLKLQLIL